MAKQVHAPEIETDVALARRLLGAQFPQWAHLPLAPVIADSTSNAMYRLGADMAVRLPRRASSVLSVDKEHRWIARLAPHLPLAVPLPLAKGAPDEGYPYTWSVVRWLDGETLRPGVLADEAQGARDLAGFIRALRALDAQEGPLPGDHNSWRGVHLTVRDANMRERFDWLSDIADIAAITQAWDRDLAAPRWDGARVWIHGDLKDANLVARNGCLSGVLDWSCAGIGDPACDLSPGWTLFDGAAREAFRRALDVDEATWRRGRAWAMIEGVLALSYYRGKNEAIAAWGRRVIDVVLADHARET